MMDLCPCFDFSGHVFVVFEDGVCRCKFCYCSPRKP